MGPGTRWTKRMTYAQKTKILSLTLNAGHKEEGRQGLCRGRTAERREQDLASGVYPRNRSYAMIRGPEFVPDGHDELLDDDVCIDLLQSRKRK